MLSACEMRLVVIFQNPHFMTVWINRFPQLGVFAFTLLVAGILGAEETQKNALNLIACPDCEEQVSRRAVMCPACGCPGEAVAVEAKRIQDARKPKSVVNVEAPTGGGSAVAVKFNHQKYVLTTLAACGSAASLSLETVTGESIAYRNIEVAVDAPLVRFAVISDAIIFLAASESGKSVAYLDESGAATENESQAIAALNAEGKLSAIKESGVFHAVSSDMRWNRVQPAAFRSQMALLSDIRAQAHSRSISVATLNAVKATKWISPSVKTEAERIIGEIKTKGTQ